jgi:hypothetical protein
MRVRILIATIVGLGLMAMACSNSSAGTAASGGTTAPPTIASPSPTLDPNAAACQGLQQIQQTVPQVATATGSTRQQLDARLIQLNSSIQAAAMALGAQNAQLGTLLQNTGLAVSALQAALASGIDVTKAQDALDKLIEQGMSQLNCVGASASPTATSTP